MLNKAKVKKFLVNIETSFDIFDFNFNKLKQRKIYSKSYILFQNFNIIIYL